MTLYASGFQVTTSEMTAPASLGVQTAVAAGYYMPGAYTTADIETYDTATYALQAYTGFASAVKTALDAAATSTFTVTLSATTGLYTVSRTGNFSLTWSTASDIALRNALGFTGNKSGASTYTSDVVPGTLMVSAIDGRTNVVGPYEADDIAEEMISDGGDASVVTRKTTDLLMSWQQSMEPRSAVYLSAARATSNALSSWQTFFRSCRGTHPVFVNDTSLEGEPDGSWYRMTARGAAFKPQRVTADFDDFWIIPFEAHYLGRTV